MGPFNDNIGGIFGCYSPDPDKRYITTPRVGLTALGRQVAYTDGCNGPSCNSYNDGAVKQAVTGADLVVVNLGTGL